MDLKTYNYWGKKDEPPPHLKTKKQLSQLGLSPIAPAGIIHTRKYNIHLYDPDNPESAKPKRKCTEKQLETLAKQREKQVQKRRYREWWECGGRIEIDRAEAVKTARKWLESPGQYVILDTETTGLGESEIVEIAVIDLGGNTLLNTLVRPTTSIPEEVSAIHGITDEIVATAPTFPSAYPLIVEAIKDKTVLIYNREFDIKILNYCRNLHKLPSFKLKNRSECVMELYSQWYGEWSNHWHSYKWQPLNGGHRALGDCLAALERIKKVAEDSDQVQYPDGVTPMG